VENIEPDDSDDEDIAAAEEAIADNQVEHDDDGQIEHDWEAVKSSRDRAIEDMWVIYDVRMTPEEERMALKIFPAVYISYFLMQYLNI
jgi:hypothetical protein